MTLDVKDSPFIFGIDLGTSNSAISLFLRGQTEIIPIEGVDTLPSVVSIRPEGEVLVGRQARNRLIVDPNNTVASVKRLMGVVDPETGKPKTWKFDGNDKEYTPEDISAEILAKLKSGADQAGTFDLRGTPRYVVICIPANFDDLQKRATLEAAKLANLEVLQLLEEPVAAAIAYATERERDQTILVYDLGGGTFDLSILKVDSTKKEGRSAFKILAKEGVPKLGGDDFDLKIMEIAAARFLETSQVDILDLKKDQGINTKALREAQQKLKEAAEEAKRELTDSNTATIAITNLIKDEGGVEHHLETEITRSEFNEAIRPLLLQSQAAVERALDSAQMTIEDISRIILVGGSTRMPLVSELLTELFGKEPYKDTNPDTVVARGAAIYAATMTPPVPTGTPQSDESFVIENLVTHFLGIEIQGGRFSCLLQKGQEIAGDAALSVSESFSNPRDNMTELPIRVYQSDQLSDYVRAEGCRWIDEFFVKISPKPRGQEKVEVTFELDQQNLLRVRAKSSIDGKELEINRA